MAVARYYLCVWMVIQFDSHKRSDWITWGDAYWNHQTLALCQGWFTRDSQGHGTPENGKRDPYYSHNHSHIFRDFYRSGMGIVWGPRGPMSLGVPENPTDYGNFTEEHGGDGRKALKPPFFWWIIHHHNPLRGLISWQGWQWLGWGPWNSRNKREMFYIKSPQLGYAGVNSLG